MGHAAGKDVYRRLGIKIDSLTFRAPWNETFHALLKELPGKGMDDSAIVRAI